MNSNTEINNQASINFDGEDFISGLSDDILSCILNFLPTKDAIKTSILAQSWKYKWRLIASIALHDFLTDPDGEENEMERAHSFIESLNRVLNQISNSTIYKLKVQLQKRTYELQDLGVLVSNALKREVQELDIEYLEDLNYEDDISPISASVFNSKSLVKLVLDLNKCIIGVQFSICLPNLQSLLLGGIQLLVADDLFPHSGELVLSFPVLKSFEAYRCDWANVKDLSINAPMLEKLTLEHSLFKFEDIKDERKSFAIKVHAPHLREFSYQYFCHEDIIFSNDSSIQEAHIGLSEMTFLEEEFSETTVRTGKLLKAMNKVEYLELGFDQFLFMKNPGLLNHVNDYLTTLPAFGSLLQLELFLPRCLESQKLLLNLIHKAPILQILTLHYTITEFDNNLLLMEEVPHCLLHTLEEVEFFAAEADAIIINLAKYVLQHSRMLKLMTICLCSKELVVIENVNQVLLSSSKASSSVRITVM